MKEGLISSYTHMREEELLQHYGTSFSVWAERYAFVLCHRQGLAINYFVSVPFCKNKCHFCDLPMEGVTPSDKYIDDLLWQMAFVKHDFDWNADAYFWFGAGTTTVMSTAQFLRIASFITCNPKCIEADLGTCHKVFEWCKETSISTLSLGVQTLSEQKRIKYNIQRSFRGNVTETILETYELCIKYGIKLNIDFICFEDDCNESFEEVERFLGKLQLDVSIYPYVPYFSSPEYEQKVVLDARYKSIDRFMRSQSYTQMSANGYYSLQPDQVLRRYFWSDYVIGIGKYGRIVPKTHCIKNYGTHMHG